MGKIAPVARACTIFIMPRNNLTKWRDARGMSRSDLAQRVGTSLATISRIESGKQTPRDDMFNAILAVFQMKRADFYAESSNITPADMGTVKVPLIDYEQAALFTADEVPNFLDDEDQEFILTKGELSGMAFALTIKGDSMSPMFKEGDMVIVDHDVAPGPGDYVVAHEKGGEVTFRKYRAVGSDESGKAIFELVPLNDDYASVRSDVSDVEIIGTMMSHTTFRKR